MTDSTTLDRIAATVRKARDDGAEALLVGDCLLVWAVTVLSAEGQSDGQMVRRLLEVAEVVRAEDRLAPADNFAAES